MNDAPIDLSVARMDLSVARMDLSVARMDLSVVCMDLEVSWDICCVTRLHTEQKCGSGGKSVVRLHSWQR